MTTSTDSVAALARALAQLTDLLAAVQADDLDSPTPCSGWSMGDLVGHVLADPTNLLAMTRGEEVDWSAAAPAPTSGWAQEFRSAADDLVRHWQALGDHAPAAQVDWQTAEFSAHAWDLARALGRPTDALDHEAAERGLAFMQATLKPEMRGEAFGPEQPAPPGASAPDRLAAFAGRSLT